MGDHHNAVTAGTPVADPPVAVVSGHCVRRRDCWRGVVLSFDRDF